jgi:hypothetical protein
MTKRERESAYRWEREVLCKPQSLQLAWRATDGCVQQGAEAPLGGGGGGITPSVVFSPSVLQLHVHGGVRVVGGSTVLHCSSTPGSGRARSAARAAAVCGFCAAALCCCRLAPPCECRVRDRAWAWRWRATGASRKRGSALWCVAVRVAPWQARASSLALRWRTGGGGRARLGAWRSGGGGPQASEQRAGLERRRCG